ncbi:MAG: hypothetical protein Q7Q73_02530 [Verrucomicrobiota bacterium JB024]|nr:hypothetical protein [Verrucomicrobiota bacterium JB024]
MSEGPEFAVGEVVYHKANAARLVIVAIANYGTHYEYQCSNAVGDWGTCYAQELTREKPLIDVVDA